MTKARSFWVGYAHHIYNRGNQKEKIFLTDKDRNVFLKYLKQYSKEFDCTILAYCLMPNHYHLLLQPTTVKSISQVMQRLTTLYSNYLRGEHNWIGHIFQSRYHSKIVKTEKYYQEIIQYLKENPVKSGIVKDSNDFKWMKLPPGNKNNN